MNPNGGNGKAGKRRIGMTNLFLLITLPVLAAELTIMLLIDALDIASPVAASLMDLTLLAFVIFPLNYFLVYKRMIRHMEGQSAIEEELRSLTASLEEVVRHRTAKLAASEAENISVLESTADGILRIDTKGAIQTANKAAHRLLGYHGMELLGQNVSAILPEDHLKVLVEGYTSFLGGWEGEKAREMLSSEAVKKDGERLSVELSIAECIVDAKICYVIILRDVSDRKRAEDALRKSEARYRILVEGGLLIAWEMDPALRRFTFVNRHAEKLLGYPVETWMLDGFWEDHLHPEDRLWAPQFCKGFVEKKQDHSFEYRMVAADGRTVWMRDLVSVMQDKSGAVTGIQGFMIDISDRKQAEEALLAAKNEAEQATKLKDKFVTLVSHDLKGPIGIVLGFIKLVLHRTDEHLSPDSRRLLGNAAEAGDKMAFLIDDLLNVSRIKAGKISPKLKFLDAHYLATRVVAGYQPIADTKQLTLENTIPPSSRMYGDETLLLEVLNNLVSNALKFSHPGGSVRLSMTGNKNPTIAVTDTGVGMRPPKLKKLFDYAEQTSTPGTANEPGTGLGLPLSREIMEAHGGTLTVQSEPGRGTVFYAELPYVQPTVLIVDDEEAARLLLKRLLAELDATIVEAENGQKALEILASRPVHLVISNVMMPVMGGLEFLTRFKQDRTTASTPVIMLTSDGSRETRENALGLGADDYSTKPVDLDDLLPRIRHFIG